MKLARLVLSAVAVLWLLGGYLLSQYEQLLLGNPAGYAASVDVPQVRLLSVVLLVGAIALAFVPEKENDPA